MEAVQEIHLGFTRCVNVLWSITEVEMCANWRRKWASTRHSRVRNATSCDSFGSLGCVSGRVNAAVVYRRKVCQPQKDVNLTHKMKMEPRRGHKTGSNEQFSSCKLGTVFSCWRIGLHFPFSLFDTPAAEMKPANMHALTPRAHPFLLLTYAVNMYMCTFYAAEIKAMRPNYGFFQVSFL